MKKWLLLLSLLISVPVQATTVCSLGYYITQGAQRLRNHLLTDYHPDWVYVGNRVDPSGNHHDGVPGDSSAGLVARLGRIPQCDIAMVLIGTNDHVLHD